MSHFFIKILSCKFIFCLVYYLRSNAQTLILIAPKQYIIAQFRTNIPNLSISYAKIDNYLQKIPFLSRNLPPPEKVAKTLIFSTIILQPNNNTAPQSLAMLFLYFEREYYPTTQLCQHPRQSAEARGMHPLEYSPKPIPPSQPTRSTRSKLPSRRLQAC